MSVRNIATNSFYIYIIYSISFLWIIILQIDWSTIQSRNDYNYVLYVHMCMHVQKNITDYSIYYTCI